MADASLLNPDELESVNRAIASNIRASEVGMAHPGAPTSGGLIFSHEESSTLDAMIGQYRQGIIKIPASSNSMAANANFTILNRSVLSAPYISGSYTIPQGAVKGSLAYYYAINLWQLNLSGIGNLSANGMAMLTMLMRSNPTDRRNFLSKIDSYTVGLTGGTEVKFCAPLYLPWNGPGWVGGGYNLDAECSSSTLQVSIQLNPVFQWIGGVSTGVTGGALPTSFTNYYMKMMNQLDILSQALSPAKISPRGLFRLPFPYYQQYPLFSTPNAGPNNIQSLSLQSIPNGELVSIAIWGAPSNGKGTSSVNTAVDFSPVSMDYYRLELQGTRLIELESAQEIAVQQNYFSVGSSSGFNFNLVNGTFTTVTGGINTYTSTTASTTTPYFTALECFTSNPSNFMDGNGVTQLAQNFSGQIFTFFYKLSAEYDVARYPYIDWYVTYVTNAVLEVADGNFKMIT